MGVDIYGIVVVFGSSSIDNDCSMVLSFFHWKYSHCFVSLHADNARYSEIMRTIEFSNNSMVANKFSNNVQCQVFRNYAMVVANEFSNNVLLLITRRMMMRTILEKGIISNEVTISTNNMIPIILVTMVPFVLRMVVLLLVMVWTIRGVPK